MSFQSYNNAIITFMQTGWLSEVISNTAKGMQQVQGEIGGRSVAPESGRSHRGCSRHNQAAH